MTDVDGAEQALLFQERGSDRKAITREPLQLPPSDLGWELVQSFTLGVQHVMPIDMEPEPVLRGISADGYYVWDTEHLGSAEQHGPVNCNGCIMTKRMWALVIVGLILVGGLSLISRMTRQPGQHPPLRN